MLAGEFPRGHRLNDLFDFRGDDVAAGELRIAKILRKMRSVSRCWMSIVFDRLDRQVGIDGLTAEVVEGFEALDGRRDWFVAAASIFSLTRFSNFGDVLLEFGDRGVPFLVVGLAIFEES